MSDNYNSVQGTVAVGGTNSVTISDAAYGRSNPFSVLPVGWQGGLRFDDLAGTAWQLAKCTVVSAGPTVVSIDTVLGGSGGAAKIALTNGMLVQHVLTADQCNAFMTNRDIPFSTALPFDKRGESYMPSQALTGSLALTVGAGAVKGAYVYGQIVGNGSDTVTTPGFKEVGGSMGFDIRAGIANKFAAWYDGYDKLISWMQTVGAVPVDLIVPTASSAAVANATPTTVTVTCSEALDSGFVPAAGSFTIAGHTPTAVGVSGSTFTLTVPAFVNAEAARTLAYVQPGSNGLRDLAGNLMASFSGLAIVNNVGVTPTVPAAPAAPVATAGQGNASLAFTLPSAGTGTISSLSFTPYLAGVAQAVQTTTTLSSPFVATGLTPGSAYTFTFHANSNVGAGAESPASNSVTPTVSYTRLTALKNVTESGTGPYSYTSAGSAGWLDGSGGVSPVLPANTDGSIAQTINVIASANGFLLGVTASAAKVAYTGTSYAVYSNDQNAEYKTITGGNPANSTASGQIAQAGDTLRLRRAGTTLVAEFSRAATPTTWVNIRTWTGVPVTAIYFQVDISGSGSVGSNITGVNV